MIENHRALLLAGGMLASGVVGASGDREAGAAKAMQCAACHGPVGISTADDFPNLASQKEAYLAAQLTAFRAGERENALMNAVAMSLTDADIENLAAHFSSLAGAAPGTVSEVSGLDGSLPSFPADYEESFTRYQRIDFPDRAQVRYYWANDLALANAEADADFDDGAYLLVEIFGADKDGDGKPVFGDDGQLVQTERSAFTAMEKGAGWGDDVPAIIDNGNWRYAVFSTDGIHKAGLNEAPCLACHKPLTDTDYSFTYETLKEYARAN